MTGGTAAKNQGTTDSKDDAVNITDIPKKTNLNKLKLLFVIVNRGLGEQVCSLLRKSHVTFNLISPGHGAAGTDFKDYIGITATDKDIVFSVITEDKTLSILDKLVARFNMDQPGNGIAFTISIAGVSGPLALRYMAGFFEEVKPEKAKPEKAKPEKVKEAERGI